MQAIHLDRNVWQYLLTKLLGVVWEGAFFSPLSPASLSAVAEIPLPGPEWVRVRNRLAGICGSDLSAFFLASSVTGASAALPRQPRLYLGHEVCGEVTEAGAQAGGLVAGQRVVLQKSLPSCFNKQIAPRCPHCQAGSYSLCENLAEADVAVDLGGGWSEQLLAHHSQLIAIPDEISDEEAVLIEPAAAALHAVLLRPPRPGDHVLVVGAGIMGLLTLQLLKRLEPACRVSVVARHAFQRIQAWRYQADHVMSDADSYGEAARITNAKRYRGALNNQLLIGGFDKIFDCVGTGETIHRSLRWCKAGGAVVLMGLDLSPSGFDHSPLVLQETELVGSFCHGVELYRGERISSFHLVMRLLQEQRLELDGLITHRFRLEDFRQALIAVRHKRSSRVVKAVFELGPAGERAAALASSSARAAAGRRKVA